MGDDEHAKVLWIVVGVQSGIPVLVEAFRDNRLAKMREQALRRRMRPDYDEAGLFEVTI
jgi:hypothetical protein